MGEEIREILNRIEAGEKDPVTEFFESMPLPNYEDITEAQYIKAKETLSKILKKYDGKDNIPPEVMKFYNQAQAIVYVVSKQRMKENIQKIKDKNDRHNKIADFLTQYQHLIGYSGLRGEHIAALYSLAEKNLLIGTENLAELAEKHSEGLYQVLTFVYDEYIRLKDPNFKPRIIMVLPKITCNGNYFKICG